MYKTINITVTAKSLVAQTGNYNINVWIIEDSVIGPNVTGYNQVNAYNATSGHPFFGAGNPVVGFVHRHVERAFLGGAWGTTGIIPANAPANGTYTKTYSHVIPDKYDMATTGAPSTILKNISMVAMVMKDTTSKFDREIMNAIQAKLVTTTGVGEIASINDLSVYPNPAQNNVTVKGILNQTGDVKLSIVNTVGQVVLEKNYNYSGSLFGENISIESLNNGIYFLNITVGDNAMTMQKLIVNR